MQPVDRIKFMQENLPEEYRLAITPYFAKIDDIAAERNADIEQHNKTKELLQQESTKQEVERVESYRRAVKTKTTSELVQDGFGIFEKEREIMSITSLMNLAKRLIPSLLVMIPI